MISSGLGDMFPMSRIGDSPIDNKSVPRNAQRAGHSLTKCHAV